LEKKNKMFLEQTTTERPRVSSRCNATRIVTKRCVLVARAKALRVTERALQTVRVQCGASRSFVLSRGKTAIGLAFRPRQCDRDRRGFNARRRATLLPVAKRDNARNQRYTVVRYATSGLRVLSVIFRLIFPFVTVDMIDVNSLINAIEKEECLWNNTVSNYMDKRAKKKAWVNVASVIFKNWDTFTNKEQKLHGKYT
jgi:hypothetical protein